MKKGLIVFILVSISAMHLKAQMSGVYNVPSTIPSLAVAISSLNSVGISGPVTINVNAGYTETVPTGGLVLGVIAGATSTSQVVFQRSGSGPNPQLLAYGSGTGTPLTTKQDGIFWFVGTDYTTIDGIDLLDINTSNPSTMEFGYGFYKANANDGCQFNTIKNCKVTLNRINSFGGTWSNMDGCRGIDVINATFTNNITALTVTSSSGSNSYNKFYGNTIQNVNIGIGMSGYVSLTPLITADIGNEIGNASLSTGNTIINFGGGANLPSSGIVTDCQYSLTVCYNYINNNNGSGVNPLGSLRGMCIEDCGGTTNNVFSNTITLTGGGTSGAQAAIQNRASSVFSQNALVNINSNHIVNCTYTTTTGGFNAVSYAGSQSYMNVNNNYIANLNFSGTGTVTLLDVGVALSVNSNTITNVIHSGSSGSMRCIQGGAMITNNLFEGLTWSSPASTGILFGCSAFSVTGTFSNNIIRNFYTPSTGTITGITDGGSVGSKTIAGNQVYNFGTSAGGAGGATIYGVDIKGGNISAFANSIYSLSSTGTTGGTTGTITGIAISGGTNHSVYKNKVFDLSSSSKGAIINGLSITGGTVNTIYNNLIGNLTATASVGTNQVIGINIIKSTTNRVYHNTVYLNSISSASVFGSSAITVSVDPNLDLQNNILVNTSVATGSGVTVAYRRITNSFTTYSATSNNNLFYSGTPSPTRLIFADLSTTCITLADYKWYALFFDHSSVTENPSFVSTSGLSPNFLEVSITNPTQVESGGLPISGVIDDFAGTTRNANTPDIGAWENNYNYVDLLKPSYLGANFISSACDTTARTFTVSILDKSGIATGSLSPRVYYRVNTGPYSSSQGTLTAGTFTNGVWTFNLTYTAVAKDVIQYYVLAQDNSAQANLMVIPPGGFSGTDVNNVTTPPVAPTSFSVMYTLGGTYTVGTAGTFTTITDASYAYNNSCLTGPVTFLLNDISYGISTETFPLVFKYNPGASPTNSLLIRPHSGVYVSITGSSTASAVFKFLDARYITLDGVNSGTTTNLVVQHFNPNAAADFWFAAESPVSPGSTNITVKRTNIYGGSSASFGTFGFISTFDGPIPTWSISPQSVASSKTHSITIQENYIYKNGYGVVAIGTPTAGNSIGGLNGWIVKDNYFGGAASSTVTNIGGSAIELENVTNFTVTGNTIRNIHANLNSDAVGIETYSTSSSVISNNLITNFTSTVSALRDIFGMFIGNGVSSTTISGNQIRALNSATSSAYGMYVYLANNNYGLRFYNNAISNIDAKTGPIGILIEGNPAGPIDFDHNSVSLSGSYAGATGSTTSSVVYIDNSSTGSNLKFRNNIFSNTWSNPTGPGQKNFAFCFTGSFFSAYMDHNDYYAFSTGSALGYFSGTVNSISAMQAVFGNNLNSISVQPVFNSASDLHLQVVAANIPLDNLGTPTTGIVMDIDNQIRSVTAPDMGADEVTIPVCSVANAGSLSSATYQACAGQNISLSTTGASTGVNAYYQWQVSSTSGGPYNNVSGGSGATTTSYSTSSLSPGIYYYVLIGTCGTSTVASVSNEATVTVISPTLTTTTSVPIICVGQSATLSVTGANTYTWSTGNNSANIVISPTVNTTYMVIGSDTTNCTASAIITQSVSACTDVSSIEKANSIKIQPNPNNGEFSIFFNSVPENISLEIYNSMGQLVLNETITGQNTRINLREAGNGIYFVRMLERGQLIYSSNVIKQ